MQYTFVKGSNIRYDVKVGDTHTWDQAYPHVGGYPGRPDGRPPRRITGTVVRIDDDLWVQVEAEEVR